MARRLRNQTIREEINTEGANSYARSLHNSPDDVKLNWWEMFSTYRIKKWRQELKDIVEKTDVTFEYICEYLGAEYSGRPGFYKKMPKCRETYIGIGMACGMPLSTINRWIVKYGGKRRLYVKDALNNAKLNLETIVKDENLFFSKLYLKSHKLEEIVDEQ